MTDQPPAGQGPRRNVQPLFNEEDSHHLVVCPLRWGVRCCDVQGVIQPVNYLVALGVRREEANAMTIKQASAKIDELKRKAQQSW